MLTRREMIAGGAAALVGCAGPRKQKRPNVVFAIADDQSFPHSGYYKDPVVRTPAFDRVAREGVVFNNSFANCPSVREPIEFGLRCTMLAGASRERRSAQRPR